MVLPGRKKQPGPDSVRLHRGNRMPTMDSSSGLAMALAPVPGGLCSGWLYHLQYSLVHDATAAILCRKWALIQVATAKTFQVRSDTAPTSGLQLKAGRVRVL